MYMFREVYDWVVEYLEYLMMHDGADVDSLPGVITNAIIAYEADHKQVLVGMTDYPFPRGETVTEKSVKVTCCDKESNGFCH